MERGLRLQELRDKHNFSQLDVARKLGIHKNTISGYETGARMPSVDVLIKLAKLYDTSVDFILGLTYQRTLILDNFTPKQEKFILEMVDSVKENFSVE